MMSFIVILNAFRNVHYELTLKGKGIVYAERHWKEGGRGAIAISETNISINGECMQ